MTRFNNVHLGTDKKVTLKDINLTPGPGDYLRVDEQYSRTFHHTTKHGTGASPTFSLINSVAPYSSKAVPRVVKNFDAPSFGEDSEMMKTRVKRNSMPRRQASHLFGIATESDQFYSTVK